MIYISMPLLLTNTADIWWWQVVHRMSALSICHRMQRVLRQSHVSGACWDFVVIGSGHRGNRIRRWDEAAQYIEACSIVLWLWLQQLLCISYWYV